MTAREFIIGTWSSGTGILGAAGLYAEGCKRGKETD